jgi:4-amino-4-deoxy-L-arabinose transferase-like glycosyltransferase
MRPRQKGFNLSLPALRPSETEPKPIRIGEPAEDRPRGLVRTAAILLISLVVLCLYLHFRYTGLQDANALDMAQIGRNLISGRGFVTYVLRPLALTHGANPLHQPDVTHGPLYPFLLAIAFGLFGSRDIIVVGLSGLFYLLSVLVLYLLGTRLFNRTVGGIAALAFALNGLMLGHAISGGAITLHAFVSTSLLLVLYTLSRQAQATAEGPTQPLPRVPLLLAGLCCGLLYLADPLFIWLVPVVGVAVMALTDVRRRRAVLYFLAPVVLLSAPWMIRNYVLTGNPVFGLRGTELWMETGMYPGFSAYRMLPTELIVSPALFLGVIRKLILGLMTGIQALPWGAASQLLVFLVPSLFFRFTDPAINTVRRVLICCFLLLFLGGALFGDPSELFAAMFSGMLVFAVAYMVHLSQHAQFTRGAMALAIGCLVVVLAVPVVGSLALSAPARPLAEREDAIRLKTVAAAGEVSLSDQPWVVAWYADRPSLWLPLSDAGTRNVRSHFASTHWLFLTPQAMQASPSWRVVYNALARWNVDYAQARRMGQTLPPPYRIAGKQYTILEALDGFMPLAPHNSVSTVIAGIPATKSQAGSETAQPLLSRADSP